MRVALVGMLVAGCATVHATETFHVGDADASPRRIEVAASDAAQRLGFQPERAELKKALTDDLSVAREATFTSPAPGTLQVSSRTLLGLGASSAALAAGITQLLRGDAPSPALAPRSVPLTVALDLIFPFAGGMYVDAGDPYGRHWTHYLELGWDAAACATLAMTLRGDQPAPMMAVMLTVLIQVLVVNRILAIGTDLLQVERRNAAVESGFDLSQLPERVDLKPGSGL
jgi:hypothetical protein